MVRLFCHVTEHPTQFQDFSRNFELYIPTKIRASKNYRELLKIMKKLKKYYFKNNEISIKTVYGFINVSLLMNYY